MPTRDCDTDEEATGCSSVYGLKFLLIYLSDSNIFCGLSDTLLAGSCCIEFSCIIWCEGVASVNKRIFQISAF